MATTLAPADVRWDRALRRAIDGDGLRLVAQPIIDVARGQVGGYELLSRFAGPPQASPDVWFDHARRLGLDAALTIAVLAEFHRLRAVNPHLFCTVNVEPHLLIRPDVLAALLGSGPLAGAVVELTEHVESGDDVAFAESLAAVRAAGGLIAMDDAGTGYAGLVQLLRIRPEIVKLDRGLIEGIDQDPVKRTAVRLLGELAGQMDAWLLAEGVETRAELAEIVRIGVPLVQGWVTGRPADAWSVLAPDLRAFLHQESARVALGGHIAALVRHAVVHRPAPAETEPPETGTIVVDAAGRASAVVVADPAGGLHRVPALVAAPSSDPRDVLRRAIARPAAWHFAPVVCTDDRGVVMGLVEVRDLIDVVLAESPRSSPDSPRSSPDRGEV
ncbi:EAL domain-containing protein [Pengzhenrongella sicca]|uniref:EAL domain-containing protein n=1 Tax=Pengzhenrongella sicca TaxID=2819238 RepID=A0A8A4ZC86_9MICO|nr:EAL domain-containing protein [Pengzhenrongella sicca]QTE28483.1 EAL domain-containing protein [Pengzhenrongella sicca]